MSHAKIIWDERGIPTSPDFGDVYFSPINGLDETRYVFLDGNNLEERFKNTSDTITIIETGFGTGLNFLTVCDLWKKTAPKGAILHFISVEKYPVEFDDIQKAHAMFPELIEQSKELCKVYEEALTKTVNTSKNIKLTLLIGDVCDILQQTPEKADAWLLDGFSPAKNPEMWNQDLYNLMYKHSNEGATLATFTAASHVRNGLSEAGFNITRRKGYAYKKHMTIGCK